MVDVTEGEIANVRVTGLVPATGPGTGPYAAAPLIGSGHGIVIANDQEGRTAKVTVKDSLIEGYNGSGILVDGRQFDGVPATANGGTVRATIEDTRIEGFGPDAAVAQNGILVDGGPCLRVVGSEIVANASPGSHGIKLNGLGTSPGCATWASSIGGATTIAGNAFGLFNGTIDGTQSTTVVNARRTWWGHADGPSLGVPPAAGDLVGPYVDFGAYVRDEPAPLDVPSPIDDERPTGVFDSLVDGTQVEVGDEVKLDVVADDDFGVAKVVFAVDGAVVKTMTEPDPDGRTPWPASWIPTAADDLQNHVVTATITDAGGQTTVVTARVRVGPEVAITGGGPAPAPTPVVTASEPSAEAAAQPQPPSSAQAPGPAPVPPAAPAFPTLSLKALAPKGSAARVSATLGGPGSVTLTLKTASGKAVKVGTAKATFATKDTKTLTVSLTKRGRALLAATGRLRVAVTATVTANGRSQRSTITLTLRGKRA